VGHAHHIFIATATEVDHHQVLAGQCRRTLGDFRQGVGGFQGGDDALLAAADLEGFQRFVIGGRDVLDPPLLVQPGVLGADAGVVAIRRGCRR